MPDQHPGWLVSMRNWPKHRCPGRFIRRLLEFDGLRQHQAQTTGIGGDPELFNVEVCVSFFGAGPHVQHVAGDRCGIGETGLCARIEGERVRRPDGVAAADKPQGFCAQVKTWWDTDGAGNRLAGNRPNRQVGASRLAILDQDIVLLAKAVDGGGHVFVF